MYFNFKDWFSIILLSTSLTACATGGNVEPGDADYPKINAYANSVLKIHGTNPDGVPIKFAIAWAATNIHGYPVADGTCNWKSNWFEGVTTGYYVSLPIDASTKGGEYEFKVNTDAFIPGRCGWKFFGIEVYSGNQIHQKGFAFDPAAILVSKNAHLPNWAGMIQKESTKVDISCRVHAYMDAVDLSPNMTITEGDYLDCLDTDTSKKIRIILPDTINPDIELNIHARVPKTAAR
ncbi:hypothetical protein [Solimicrobium silvestre]|uniref:Lipoprotein n=1 Tax=Solimicrobium silvestre TaxID=2099400 RepID=A0A2S9GS79_9BURK|nr:hypothetical protein [Solimicrobium silvestre]PRC90571.1 hypothetical protein S2091_4723 [Solimicrobium silvestre]